MNKIARMIQETFQRLRPKTPGGRWACRILVGLGALWAAWTFLYPPFFSWYTGTVNGALRYDSSVQLSPEQFQQAALELTAESQRAKAEEQTRDEKDPFARELKVRLRLATRSSQREAGYSHIKYFKDAGILRYEGPQTCLKCHETMKVRKADGTETTVHTLDDVLDTIHYQFQSMAGGFSTYGYDGRKVNGKGRAIPVGKIDRACGIPGSFSWTGWAAQVEAKPASLLGKTVTRSEGCGQCHIGGNYHPATERMMPVGDVPKAAKEGLDCLICHAAKYDMDDRYVVKDGRGLRWNQDRSLRAALTVGEPTADTCLRCHQHNMGGDLYEHNAASAHPGRMNARMFHAGAKRGNPFAPQDDVHARANLSCLDCHKPEGHKIPRGEKGTDLVGNDLPGKAVDCESCHTAAPHVKNRATRAMLNGHVDRISCEACHIPELQKRSVVLRDWMHPTWNPEEGVWEPTDIYWSGKARKGLELLWFNGNGTFLANALGDNPTNPGVYNPLMDQMVRLDDPEVVAEIRPQAEKLARQYGFNVDRYLREATLSLTPLPPETLAERRKVIEEKLRPIMRQGRSRLYPFKMFNALMAEDMSNQGPFGAMILPFDYKTYYETGKPLEAVKVAVGHPIVKRMYQAPFKLYMMDEFMRYFGVGQWSDEYPMKDGQLRNVEPHWMRQMGTLMVNHGIQKEGRACVECHARKGILDYRRLGYPEARARELEDLPEVRALGNAARKR